MSSLTSHFCGEVEDVVVEEGEEEDRQEESWEVQSGVTRVEERQPCMAWRWM